MISPKFSFEMGSDHHVVYFGMTSVGIFQEKSFKEAERIVSGGSVDQVMDNLKSFAYVVYSGLCNWADIEDERRPRFSEAYFLAERIVSEHPSVMEGIWQTWLDSQPVKTMLDRMNAATSKQKKSTTRKAG